ncbi:MAG: hypothetical protein QOE61_836, partial [Micromonosporaceae bacterium]|nr:hypothetical protein [Micromonosporaceae bacterium]
MTKFLLLSKCGPGDDGAMTDWSPTDITAHLDFLRVLNREL